jgi:hypothetical protein
VRSYAAFFKLQLSEPSQILPGLMAEVRAQGPTTIVLLSHLGSKQDVALAEQLDGLDVILGAHDHVALNPPLVVNQTIIAQAGDYGRFLGASSSTSIRRAGKSSGTTASSSRSRRTIRSIPRRSVHLKLSKPTCDNWSHMSSGRPRLRSISHPIVNAQPEICWPMPCGSECTEK